MLLCPIKLEPSKIKQNRFSSGFAPGETFRSSEEIQIKVLYIRQRNISGDISSLVSIFDDGAHLFVFHLRHLGRKKPQTIFIGCLIAEL